MIAPESPASRSRPGDSSTVDPLAGLLPPGDPMQPVSFPKPVAERPQKSAKTKASATTDLAPVPPPIESSPHGVATADRAALARDIATPVIKRGGRATAKRPAAKAFPKSVWLVSILLLAAVCILGYRLVVRQGTVASSASGDAVGVKTGQSTTNRKKQNRPESGDVAKILAEERPSAPENDRPPTGSGLPKLDFGLPTPDEPAVPIGQIGGQRLATPDESGRPGPVTATPMVDLKQLMVSIKANDWDAIKSLAESIDPDQLEASQQKLAAGLLGVTDLATYYRTGIERAISELNAGQDFEVKTDFRVMVVGKTDQSLTVRFNATQRTYLIADLPRSLADRLAEFEIPSGTDRDAAKAVYHAVLSASSPTQRDQAIGELRQLKQPIQNVNRDSLIFAIQRLTKAN